MDKMLFIEAVEDRGEETVYWIEDEEGSRQFGITFEGADSVDNQHYVESILLSLSMAEDILDEIEEELGN